MSKGRAVRVELVLGKGRLLLLGKDRAVRVEQG